MKPTMQVVNINYGQQLMQPASATRASGNIFTEDITGGTGTGRSRFFDDWDEE